VGKEGPAGKEGPKGTNGTNGEPGASVTIKPYLTSGSECNKLGGSEFKVGSGPATIACNGSPGANGESVTSKGFTGVEGTCTEGGSEFESESAKGKVKTYACNGSPWTAGGMLPRGQEEKGSWSATGGAEASVAIEELMPAPISFTIPLASAPTPHFIDTNTKEVIWNKTTEKQEEVTSTECKGTAASPSAEPGNLCVYAGTQDNARPGEFGFAFDNPSKGVGTEGEVATDTGAMLAMETEKAATFTLAWGTWAVKAA
jgi:hypothetical protein